MSMSVLNQAGGEGNLEMYSLGIRQALEDHLEILQTTGISTIAQLTAGQASKYKGDFYGLLGSLGVSSDIQWITMRVNGYHSPADYTEDRAKVLILQPVAVSNILDRHLATRANL